MTQYSEILQGKLDEIDQIEIKIFVLPKNTTDKVKDKWKTGKISAGHIAKT